MQSYHAPSPAALGKVHQVGPKHQSVGHMQELLGKGCFGSWVVSFVISVNHVEEMA